MGTNISKQGIAFASGAVNPNLFSWQNKGASTIVLNDYQNTGSFTQFNNCLTFDPSTTIGTKYTISLWARSPNGATKLHLYNSNGTPRYFYFSTILTNSLGTDWQFFTYTFTNQDRGSGNIYNRIEIYMPSQMKGEVKEIKIEEGEISTAWLPATTDALYVGNTCGFTELGKQQGSIAKECMSANQFYEL